MKKTISLIVAVLMLLSTMTAFANPFSDTEGHWAKDEIIKAYENKAISGDPDGTFRPDDAVSRAEFLKMTTALLAEKFDVLIPEIENKTHWADKYYDFSIKSYLLPNTALEYEGVSPAVMSKENFDTPVTRWEMAYILGNAFTNVYMMQLDTASEISDLDEIEKNYDAEITKHIKSLISLEIFTGDENGNFNAKDNGTRAEAAVLINRSSALMDELHNYYEETQKQQEEQIREYEDTLNNSVKEYTEIPKGHPVVRFTMSDGQKFEITLYPEYAPQTVANFISLVANKFYDGLTFHRIVDGFVAQGGDPNGDGTGSADHTIFGEFLSNGFSQNTLKHEKGVVSMARSQFPNSASSQFFICYNTLSELDGQYAAFGKVTKGMDVVESFLKAERELNIMGEISTPVKPVTIGKAEIIKKK